MADDGATLYVKTDSGSVAVIDPAKSAEVRRLPLGARGLCQGIGAAAARYGAAVTRRQAWPTTCCE